MDINYEFPDSSEVSNDEEQIPKTLVPRGHGRPDYTKATNKAIFDEGLSYPEHVCTDPVSGNIVVTDCRKNMVYILKDTLQLLHSFRGGGLGYDGNRQMSGPCGVAVYGGYIYISDYNNHRICVVDTQGDLQWSFGHKGTKQEHYKKPEGLAVDSRGRIYVCDNENQRIKVTDKEGKYVHEFGKDVFGDYHPIYIAVSNNKKVAVTTIDGRITGDIYMFTTDGLHTQTIKKNTLPDKIFPSGVSFDCHGQLLVSDRYGHRVVVLSDQLEVKCFIDTSGRSTGEPNNPYGMRGVAVTRNGGVVVCDIGNGRIHLFDVPKEDM